MLSGWWPDPTKVPQPRLFFLIDKTYDTPPRLIQFLALIALYVGDLSLHPPVRPDAGGFPVDARPQLALRVLRRVYPEPCRADHSLHLPRQSFDRHRGGNLRYRNHGLNSMASRMARRCESDGAAPPRRSRPDPIGRLRDDPGRERLGSEQWPAGVAADAGAVLARLPGRHDGDGEQLAACRTWRPRLPSTRRSRSSRSARRPRPDAAHGMAATPERRGKFSGRPSRASTS